MAVPMRKLSKRRTRMRASHHAIQTRSLRPCPRCEQRGLPHRVCDNCGHYRGREIINKED